MMNRRCVGVGLLILLAGGCATQPKPAVTSITDKTGSKQQTDQARLQPKPGSPGSGVPDAAPAPTAAQLLAMKSAEYARSMQDVDAASPGAPPAQSKTLIADPAKTKETIRRSKDRGSALGAETASSAAGSNLAAKEQVGLPVEATAQLATGRLSPREPASGDGPREVAESADYTTSGPGSDALAQRLLKRARENPRDISNQLDLQLFGMLNDEQSPELATMNALSAEDRELVASLVDGLSNFRSTVRQDANMLMPQKIKPLMEMIERVRSQADLNVTNLTLCRRVDAYGKYDPITPARFPAMKESRVIVYCEIENFLPKQNIRQMWETNLTEEVTLYTDTGLVAWSDTKRRVTDECRNRRHDFFAFNIITLPPTLSVGRYILKVSVHDDNADRIAEDHLQVNVTAQ